MFATLGRSWDALGPLLAALGRSWAALGPTYEIHPKNRCQKCPIWVPKLPENGSTIGANNDKKSDAKHTPTKEAKYIRQA